MGLFFYNIFLWFFKISAHVGAWFNPKAKLWVKGRKNVIGKLKENIRNDDKIVWMHCASLGEFEQGRPLLEAIRVNYPGYRILLSFFSPSGYEVQKNYPGADWVIYMPLDGPLTAKYFLETVKPALVIFVKYEFWYYYLKKIKYRNIPLLLVSAYFRRDMAFFKWHGALQRKMLSRFDHLFVQDETSKQLLDRIGLAGICTVSGDTRFDRVLAIAAKSTILPVIEKFIGTSPVLIAGSTWPEDETVLQEMLREIGIRELRLIIAPHEIDEKHMEQLEALFPAMIRYSGIKNNEPVNEQEGRVLVMDSIGLLSALYRYARFSYVGGGMTPNGVHNVLEAAVYDNLVFFGPHFEKYREATGLIKESGAIMIRNGKELAGKMMELWNDPGSWDHMNRAAGDFVRSQAGATKKILSFIQEKRLLTS